MFTFDLDFKWDTASTRRITQFGEFEGKWNEMHKSSAPEIAKIAQDYFTPMLNVRSQQTGATKDSITPLIEYSSNGWKVEYWGLLSALYMDVGNFPAGETLNAKDKGLKAFPVDKRFGNPYFRQTIHGMGARTPGAPTHWSTKTVKNLASTQKVTRVAANAMKEFLRTVVVR